MGRWTSPGAPNQTPPQSVTPNVCHQPTPAIPRTRGVEDAAPYGRQRNAGIRTVASRCANALGSPERGAVAARSAVTEGLVQGGCGVITLPVNLRNPLTVGAYLPRPPGVGRWTTSDARVKWCAGCDARDRICVEADVTVRTVRNAIAIGHAERPQRKGERGGGVGACNRRSPSSDGLRTEDGAPYETRRNVQQQTHVIRQPTEGASGTPPPTGVS